MTKLLTQVSLGRFHEWLRIKYPISSFSDNIGFWKYWYRSRRNRYMVYSDYVDQLKQKQTKNDLNENFGEEIHGN